MEALRWFAALSLTVGLASPVFGECPTPPYIMDGNDLLQVSGTVYDNMGNRSNVKCTMLFPQAAYIAFTGGASSPPCRSFQGIEFSCPALDPEVGGPIGPCGADNQIVKNGTPANACAFVGQRDAGSGWPFGVYMNSVLKFDATTGFKSEKGTLMYNLTSGSFVGKFKVLRRK